MADAAAQMLARSSPCAWLRAPSTCTCQTLGKSLVYAALNAEFMQCVRRGNRLYDRHAECEGYLSCREVISFWPELGGTSAAEEFFFVSRDRLAQGIAAIANENPAAVGVLTESPFTVFLAFVNGRVFVFDSHMHYIRQHGCHGALVSVPTIHCDASSSGSYVSNFFERCLQSSFMKQADLILFKI